MLGVGGRASGVGRRWRAPSASWGFGWGRGEWSFRFRFTFRFTTVSGVGRLETVV